jgi:polyhydroxyalkanoate synthase
MRKGPHPLSVQISLAASVPGAEGPEFPRPPEEVAQDMKQMLLGIQKYQAHPYKAERKKLDVIWQAGETTISTIPGHAAPENSPVVLLVPSMVNRAYILDLMPERSLLHWLGAQGIVPYLLDWGEGVEDEGQQSIEDIVLQRLVPAIDFAAAKTRKKVHVLGYCMGGTLVAGAAQNAAQNMASLTFLAAPWDFHAGTKTMLARVKFWSPSAFPAIAEKGHLPMDWMQMLFASLDPRSSARKFASFVDMPDDSDEARLFVAVEDWLNDGVDLPGQVAQECIKGWFFENATAEGKWVVKGEAVDPAKIKLPSLVISSRKDRLVDYETATAIAAKLPVSKVVNPACGHIGMIAGSKAVEKVWTPIAEWVKKHD